jgi:hypothetical protein
LGEGVPGQVGAVEAAVEVLVFEVTVLEKLVNKTLSGLLQEKTVSTDKEEMIYWSASLSQASNYAPPIPSSQPRRQYRLQSPTNKSQSAQTSLSQS